MNISQSKLTKQEWNNIEIHPNKQEFTVLEIIKNYDKEIKYFNSISIADYLKIISDDHWDIFIFNKFFKKDIEKIKEKLKIIFKIDYKNNLKNIKNKDNIKIENLSTKINLYKDTIYEFILIDLMKKLYKKNNNKLKIIYTIHYFLQQNIKINFIILDFCKQLINFTVINIKQLLLNFSNCIKHNKYLKKFDHITIYKHQKQLFELFDKKYQYPKLIFYKISTGLGKTISPIGLVKKHRVIFVCAAKHVGLSLAKAAISQNIKIGLAFKCESKTDIRLHYNAATEFITDSKSGSIRKVNNLRGENVELLISDVSSYVIGMNYMKEFNDVNDIIFFWDEPTISLDYKDHEFHSIIYNNWQQNVIPNVILSSATLPSEYELYDLIDNFKHTFEGAKVIEINNNIAEEDVYLLKENNKVFLPHIDLSYLQFKYFIDKINEKKILYKFLPIKFLCEFIVNDKILLFKNIKDKYTDIFKTLNDINVDNIRNYYKYCCEHITNDQYIKLFDIHKHLQIYKSTILVTSEDAYTITNGPAIFITDNVEKTAKIYFKKSNINQNVINNLLLHINENNKINIEINKLQKQFEDIYNKENTNDEKYRLSDELKILKGEINNLQGKIKKIMIEDEYIPNKKDHYFKYNNTEIVNNLFSSNLDEEIILKVVLLEDIDNIWKILLLMGIGVFKSFTNIAYTEIIKKLAEEQKLFLIIASSDYIYGTNYNFCHGYLSKDLNSITPEKTIQAIGRIGRKQSNCIYTMRFRDDNILKNIFLPNFDNIEAANLNNLLS